MTETAATFLDPEIPTITDLGTDLQKIDGEMTYPEEIIPMRLSAKS